MTKSPVSTCGANVALCLPRRSVATWDARRPRTTSVASMTYQVRLTSPGLGVYVRTVLPSCRVADVDRRAAWSRPAGSVLTSAVPRGTRGSAWRPRGAHNDPLEYLPASPSVTTDLHRSQRPGRGATAG